jgi:hypothetical protein
MCTCVLPRRRNNLLSRHWFLRIPLSQLHISIAKIRSKALIRNQKCLSYGHDVFLSPRQSSRLFNSICSKHLGTANGRFWEQLELPIPIIVQTSQLPFWHVQQLNKTIIRPLYSSWAIREVHSLAAASPWGTTPLDWLACRSLKHRRSPSAH